MIVLRVNDTCKYGSPIAYRNLFSQKGNRGALLLMAAWSSLEGFTCLLSDYLTLVLLIGIVLDAVICLAIFGYVLKSRFSEQRKYVYMLLVWNCMETVFLLFPPSVTAIIVCFRALSDIAINMIIIFMAYYRPQRVNFAPILDQEKANSQAAMLSDPFDVDESGKLSPPPKRKIFSIFQIRSTTVPQEIRLRQAPERTEAGSAPDEDIGIISFAQLQDKLNPAAANGTVHTEEEFVAETGPAVEQPTSGSKNMKSLIGTPAGMNTLSEFLADEEFIRYSAASRLLEANTVWREQISDPVQAEAIYEKAMELEPHCRLLKTAFAELRDLVTAKRMQPGIQIGYSSYNLLNTVYSSYKRKLGDKEL